MYYTCLARASNLGWISTYLDRTVAKPFFPLHQELTGRLCRGVSEMTKPCTAQAFMALHGRFTCSCQFICFCSSFMLLCLLVQHFFSFSDSLSLQHSNFTVVTIVLSDSLHIFFVLFLFFSTTSRR